MTRSHTLLITGFGLWGGEPYNSTWETIRQLEPDLPENWTLRREKLPVLWDQGPDRLVDLLDPSLGAVICFGMCGGDRIRPERLAINLADRVRTDANEDCAPDDHLIPDGPPAYWTGFDYPELIRSLTTAGLPTMESNQAGGFLCNAVFYTLMHTRARLGARFPAGFVHLPHFESEGGLPLTDLVTAANVCVNHAIALADDSAQGEASLNDT